MLSSVCFRAFADLRMSEKKYALNISAHLVELNKAPNCPLFCLGSFFFACALFRNKK